MPGHGSTCPPIDCQSFADAKIYRHLARPGAAGVVAESLSKPIKHSRVSAAVLYSPEDLSVLGAAMARYSDSDTRDDGGFGLGSWLFGLIIGLLGGTVVAMLTTPRTGSEIRGKLKETAQDLPERVSELVDDSLDLYASGVNYLQLVMEEQTMRVKRAVAAGKLAAAKKREELELGNTSVLPFQHR